LCYIPKSHFFFLVCNTMVCLCMYTMVRDTKRHHCVTNLSRGVPYLEPHRFSFFCIFFPRKKTSLCYKPVPRCPIFGAAQISVFFCIFFHKKKASLCYKPVPRCPIFGAAQLSRQLTRLSRQILHPLYAVFIFSSLYLSF
jgi:uncharacterized RDD family membrane protein YckC